MSDLVTWLRAQLDEDERVARLAASEFAGESGLSWYAETEEYVRPAEPVDNTLVVSSVYEYVGKHTHHIACHDPARVLAEVEAKRRILDAGQPTAEHEEEGDYIRFGDFQTCSDSCGPDVWWQVVKLLAVPYADRPGYLEEWAP